ncbi:MAG: histidine--tRNA ligase family protein [Dehalococcoidales bacterium]|nr:histidine--tRNA ligase family protein [Dehalococcoidales bacterium]
MKIQRCKGMRDMSPEAMAAFRRMVGTCRDTFVKWGYREVRTPTIEYMHLFTSAGTLTPGMLGKVYSFLDWDGWSGERVVLRPDGTIPVVRLYTDSMQGLARLFYTMNMFTFESGEGNRERWQCGVELIGAGSAVADAELMALSMEIVKQLSLKGVELRLSHAGLIKVLLSKLKLTDEEQHRMFDSILDGDTTLLAKASRKLPELADLLLPLLSLKGQTADFLKNKRASLCRGIPEIRAPLDDFLKTVAVLDDLDLKYQINIASGTGFEYYTGMIFQLFMGKEKIGGGGRYDALIAAMGGGNVPASGLAIYLDRLMDRVKKWDVTPSATKRILVKASSSAGIGDAFKVADALRQAGCIAEIDLDGREADWTLEVKSSKTMTLISKVKKSKTAVGSVNAVLKLLEAEGGG